MQEKELQKLTETAKAINVRYDQYELTITFDTGMEVYITPGTLYESGIFEISTNKEREAQKIAYDERRRRQQEVEIKIEMQKQSVLNSLTPEQRINVMSLLNK